MGVQLMTLAYAYLLATGTGGTRKGARDKFRKRYKPDGRQRSKTVSDGSKQQEVDPLPPLTTANGPRPTYFTCRHSYEGTLIDEILRCAPGEASATSPYPGLVRVDDGASLPDGFDPVYALQVLPDCVVVSGESIKSIAREVDRALLAGGDDKRALEQRQRLLTAPKGSLTIHPLVPGMCKAQPSPVMYSRATKVCEELLQMQKKVYPAARRSKTKQKQDGPMQATPEGERWLLQVMLQSPTLAIASLSKCDHVGPGCRAYRPCLYHPLGLAKVDIKEKMPSSAYRKLLEALECMGIAPLSSTTVVDLGACPGGWTGAIRRFFDCRVIAIDRSELDPVLMRDDKVSFEAGDAFAFEPPPDADTWMISDIICYPERTTELLRKWCGKRLARVMVVTMKFQGNEPDFGELHRAMKLVKEHPGYNCRVKHFFNNKNEVTFMVWSDDSASILELDNKSVGTSMYSII